MATATSSLAKNNQWMPQEAVSVALGVGTGAISHVAIQYLQSSASEWIKMPTILKNVVKYSFGATAIAGIVLSVYSIVRLCKRIISQENELHKAVSATALGVLLTSCAEAIGEHFWELAPSFSHLMDHSMAYCIGTNLALHACIITGIAGIVFTAYAAYRIGKSLSMD